MLPTWQSHNRVPILRLTICFDTGNKITQSLKVLAEEPHIQDSDGLNFCSFSSTLSKAGCQIIPKLTILMAIEAVQCDGVEIGEDKRCMAVAEVLVSQAEHRAHFVRIVRAVMQAKLGDGFHATREGEPFVLTRKPIIEYASPGVPVRQGCDECSQGVLLMKTAVEPESGSVLLEPFGCRVVLRIRGASANSTICAEASGAHVEKCRQWSEGCGLL